MIVQLFYCLPSGQFFGSWVGDPVKDRNELAERGYIEVPASAESTDYFWSAERQDFYMPPSAGIERQWRDAELSEMVWLRDRHRDQVEIGAGIALSAGQFSELLVYMQALRDWPQTENFPDANARPIAPKFLDDIGGVQ